MRIKHLLTLFLIILFGLGLSAHVPDHYKKSGNQTATYRGECSASKAQVDQSINNVRARLLAGGDCWWDLSDGRYIVPKVDPASGEIEVSSIFAGSVWLGGVDPAGNLKLACQDYRSGGANDFWPGPLDETGITDDQKCLNWDQHFKVLGADIRKSISAFNSGAYSAEQIPPSLRRWPAQGNPYFLAEMGFPLPNTTQGLAGFYDANEDGVYDPLDGDYPSIEIRGCPLNQYPDEMIFWIYNDQGGGATHAVTQGVPIQMEVQVQAFGYVTLDALNDMTFQRYKLINRATEDIDSTFFAMWVDADLGCHLDDYIGCDSTESLMYIYNQDATDGQPGCSCDGTPTYCNNVPLLGVDYFRGPRDEFGNELGMSSFMYYNNGSIGTPDPATTDPSLPVEFYNYLNGYWRNGEPLTYGGSGLGGTDVVRYALPDVPADPNGWSMCTADLPFGDRRTIQATGPFLLKPGAVNELIVGVPWVPVGQYVCPDMESLFRADKLAQGAFDNCFDIPDGPDAPDVDWIEMDKEVIAVLTNNNPSSNNFQENYGNGDFNNPQDPYNEFDQIAPDSLSKEEKVYKFEGYEVYQLLNANISPADFGDITKARRIQTIDVKNGVKTIYNWEEVTNPTGGPTIYEPVLEAEGLDEGVIHTLSITQDAFATGNDKVLVNHKKYYFAISAYGYNQYDVFDPFNNSGQQKPFLRGRKAADGGQVVIHTVIPRPIVDRVLNTKYGDGVEVTRVEGVGTGDNFIRLTDETRNAIVDNVSDGKLVYEENSAPINVKIFNPFEVKNGEYELRISDANPDDNLLDETTSFWELVRTNPAGDDPIRSYGTIEQLNEQIVEQYGFSVSIGQVDPPSVDVYNNANGAIGAEITYPNGGAAWLAGVPDTDPGTFFGVFDYVKTEDLGDDVELDPEQNLSTLGDGFFVPYALASSNVRLNQNGFFPFITPAWTTSGSPNFNYIAMQNTPGRLEQIKNTRNVDIVFTNDKSKWSRCVIVETASYYYSAPVSQYVQDSTLVPESPVDGPERVMFDLRYSPSVGKEADSNGKPVPDGEVDSDGDPVYGMGWFPGYAVDVETGERLNIFFGENSCYSSDLNPEWTGRDMMFNPTGEIISQTPQDYNDIILGGHHYVYVTDEPYDGCANIYSILDGANASQKRPLIKLLDWAGMITTSPLAEMSSYAEGLIPSDCVVSLRVKKSYESFDNAQVESGTTDPLYQFTIDGAEATDLDVSMYDAVLDSIKAVPNPYYGFSDYETSQFVNTIKITNLPAKCQVTIYTIDGRFIRQFDRDEVYSPYSQIIPDLEWDLKNSKGIPVSSGVYLFHVSAPGLGERTIKWFGINRKFDPSGL